MQNIKFKTSVFSRYLISLIVLLFSYLFYLSIPVFYNYGDLQKDITKKLLKEFNLNAALSANITYKILPSPNFEISNVILSTDSDKKFNEFYSWHYVNMDLNQKYSDAEKNPKGDLVTGINKCIQVLKDENSAEEDKVFYLKMLVHFVGDLHQPLHIGQKEDKGGNTIQVQWFGKGTNLHTVWDSKMIEEWNMSYLELAKNSSNLSKLT